MVKKITKALLLVFWMGVIFSFSMDNGIESKEKSRGVLSFIYEKIFLKDSSLEEKEVIIEKYEFFIRKTAHFFLYFVLAFLFLFFIEEFYPINIKTIFFSFLFILLYACSDEIHQLFIEERSGKIIDIIIDTLGGIISSIIYLLGRRKIYAKKEATR